MLVGITVKITVRITQTISYLSMTKNPLDHRAITFPVSLNLLFGCPTANFGSLPRRQPDPPDVNHSDLQFLKRGWVPKNGKEPCGSSNSEPSDSISTS